ncbi:hypothetical protein F4810DRAFT_34470 [Camillea tinctor]|nr:hypothetical protein F4810DRAFT_34470 [Camillea tinctor]
MLEPMDPEHGPLPFHIRPISGDKLYALEVERRRKVRHVSATGCQEIDREVLGAGGWERGTVVGISAEEGGEVGVLIGLQTIAHSLLFNGGNEKAGTEGEGERAAIVTTLSATSILPLLRDVLRAVARQKLGKGTAVEEEVRRCLRRISVSRVFDIEGLGEVIAELEGEADGSAELRGAGNAKEEESPAEEVSGKTASPPPREESPPMTLPPLRIPSHADTQIRRQGTRKDEIRDSEDEDDELLSSPSPSSPPEPSPPAAPAVSPQPAPPPSLILITHFSTLLTTLFAQRAADRPAAHAALQRLASRLRALARTRGALVMLLNSTTATFTPSVPAMPPLPPETQQQQPPTLRSIFSRGENRRNHKPAFGGTFAQFLDVHVLCSRVPRGVGDAEILTSAAAGEIGEDVEGGGVVRWVWAVEVLLDEVGWWEEIEEEEEEEEDGKIEKGKGKGKGKAVEGQGMVGEKGEKGKKRYRRRNREQKWGAVDVRDGVLVVDAFGRERYRVKQGSYRNE